MSQIVSPDGIGVISFAKSKKFATLKKQHVFKARMGGQTRTIFIRPLRYSIDETDISLFEKKASLSAPLRIDLFCHRYPNDTKHNIEINNDEKQDNDIDIHINNNNNNINKDRKKINNDEYCAYAYVTFPTHDDCELVVHQLNKTRIETNDKKNSSIPVRV